MIESRGSIQQPENYCDKKKMRMLSGESRRNGVWRMAGIKDEQEVGRALAEG